MFPHRLASSLLALVLLIGLVASAAGASIESSAPAGPSPSVPPSESVAPSESALPTPTPVPTTRVVPVLMYHRIGNPPAGARYPGLYVAVSSFRAQMNWLYMHGFHPITAAELGVALRYNRPVPIRSVVISLDDGRPDSYTAAWPILAKYGFRATFYVIPGLTRFTVGSRISWAQAATLAAAGNEIGNHSMTHTSLWLVHGAALARQVVTAGKVIETRLASLGVTYKVTTFCYPYGHWTGDALLLLRDAGYNAAFTTQYGRAVIGSTNRLLVPRLRVDRSLSLAGFAYRLPH